MMWVKVQAASVLPDMIITRENYMCSRSDRHLSLASTKGLLNANYDHIDIYPSDVS